MSNTGAMMNRKSLDFNSLCYHYEALDSLFWTFFLVPVLVCAVYTDCAKSIDQNTIDRPPRSHETSSPDPGRLPAPNMAYG